MLRKTIILLFVFSFAAAFCFAGGSGDSEEEKVYVFATDATWPPMEYVDENGDIVGFDIDLLKAIADVSGFKYETKNTAWDGIFAGLANGSYDAIISSVTITEERKATMDFTDSYVNAGQILVVAADYSGGDQLADFAGKTVGAQLGTTGDFAIEEMSSLDVFAQSNGNNGDFAIKEISSIDRRAYDDIGLAIEDLVNGNLDAVVCDSVIAINYVVGNDNFQGKLKILGEPFTEEDYGIAIQKGNTELLDMLNAGIRELKANGTHKKLIDKWLR